jgi:hypothetical protein
MSHTRNRTNIERIAMNRKQMIEELGKTTDFNYIGDSTGYGVMGVHYHASNEGVTWCGTQTGDEVDECPVLSAEEYETAKLHIQTGTDDDYDSEVIEMVKAGCQPGIQYWTLGRELSFGDDPEYYATYDDVLDEIWVMAGAEFTPWEDMDDQELENWVSVVREHVRA